MRPRTYESSKHRHAAELHLADRREQIDHALRSEADASNARWYGLDDPRVHEAEARDFRRYATECLEAAKAELRKARALEREAEERRTRRVA